MTNVIAKYVHIHLMDHHQLNFYPDLRTLYPIH